MLIQGQNNSSQLSVCLQAAPQFLLSATEAEDIMLYQISIIQSEWDRTCDEAELQEVDRRYLWRQQSLNPFAFYGAPERITTSIA